MDFDVFISHASEDKDNFVRQLAAKLEEYHLLVWYDEFTLLPGHSLRRSIDKGLARSRFGVVVLSTNFFKKEWANWELDGLVARQNSSENDLILPIWLDITRDQLLNYSPPLADKVAIPAGIGIDAVVARLLQVIKPEGSTLVVARDLLFKEGINAPLVTDDWWLDIVEYSGQEYLHHEYLSYEIPFESWEPYDRGVYIARHALQKMWQEEGEDILISQLTHPEEVLNFISDQPGLKSAVLSDPLLTASFFPQLTIKGFGGFLEPLFDDLLKSPPQFGNKHPCEEELAFRHENFGEYSMTELADIYFTGGGGPLGPSRRRHDQIDFIFWLLSEQSSWLPENIHFMLLQGLKDWGVWPWSGFSNSSDFEGTSNSGALQDEMWRCEEGKTLELNDKIIKDIEERIYHTAIRLQLPETVEELYERFLKADFIEDWIKKKVNSKKIIR